MFVYSFIFDEAYYYNLFKIILLVKTDLIIIEIATYNTILI